MADSFSIQRLSVRLPFYAVVPLGLLESTVPNRTTYITSDLSRPIGKRRGYSGRIQPAAGPGLRKYLLARSQLTASATLSRDSLT